jgi:hypothetical protein
MSAADEDAKSDVESGACGCRKCLRDYRLDLLVEPSAPTRQTTETSVRLGVTSAQPSQATPGDLPGDSRPGLGTSSRRAPG